MVRHPRIRDDGERALQASGLFANGLPIPRTIILVLVQMHFNVQILLMGLDLYVPTIVSTQINFCV